ncbi:PAS domain S-box/diguanylate cyclase (GGDEF) domain-containing protein [Shewanella psychrophila]|uniref:PAS domain S-box/diguanylate cyclase (GGDEF) domain-containing protein n=1 Tax=Shewanella psychrophila TaxID=225848 RepID=A0A1S6HKN8_9GAMM|nr:diguanylate cyclase [Shewanella psychrophila]AQS36069.1 PAS domain S-box/diguanylate cyclase (GGDEF) domain-containing protein [Shewanella psychrophila]
MHSPTEELQHLVDVIAASVAIVEQKQNKSGKGTKFRVVAHNELFLRMLGKSKPGKVILKTCLLDSLTSTSVSQVFNTYLPQVFSSLEPIEIEQTFELTSESPWWRLFLNPMESMPNQLQRVMIIGIHMSDKQELQSEVNNASARFSSVIDAAFDGIITMDDKQNIQLFNHAAEKIFGYSAEEIIGQSIAKLMKKKFRASHADYIKQFTDSDIQSRDMLSRVMISAVRKDNSEFPVEITISKISINGNLEFTAIIRDISNRIAFIEKLQHQVNTDNLTGLNNRNRFEGQLNDTHHQYKRFGHNFSVLMIDLDRFKVVNDTYGHLIGDKVLQEFAKKAQDVLREVDILARFGGEEFIALLPNTKIEAAKEVANRIRVCISQQMVLSENHEAVTFTVSIGVAEIAADDDTESIVRRADEALYRAKNSGRNRVSD